MAMAMGEPGQVSSTRRYHQLVRPRTVLTNERNSNYKRADFHGPRGSLVCIIWLLLSLLDFALVSDDGCSIQTIHAQLKEKIIELRGDLDAVR